MKISFLSNQELRFSIDMIVPALPSTIHKWLEIMRLAFEGVSVSHKNWTKDYFSASMVVNGKSIDLDTLLTNVIHKFFFFGIKSDFFFRILEWVSRFVIAGTQNEDR